MNEKNQVQKFNLKNEAILACGDALNKALLANKTTPILLLLSGGSALEILEEILPEALSEKLTISLLDERFSQDKKINNFSQMQTTSFYELALAKNCNVIGTLPRLNENISEFAKRIEQALQKWVSENINGKIFVTLGMGPDGHTSGIFPVPDETEFKNLFENENWVTGYTAPHKYSERVTTTITFFRLIDEAFALVCGIEKKSVMDKISEGKEKINILPALAWKKIKKITIFTDI